MCVCVCVCICSVTSGVSVHPENTVMYSVGNAGQKCGVFSETALLQRYTASGIVWLSVQLAILETTHAYY